MTNLTIMSNQKPHILIVDDNPTNIDVLFDYLDTAGFDVSAAEDGERAIEQCLYELPDIVLLDVMMPGIDGFETCRRLKELPSTKTVPIIFMTALNNVSEKVKGFEMGAVDYITKPVQHEEVLARVNNHLMMQNLQKQLETTNSILEERVKDRTYRLQVIANISKQLNEIQDLDKLLTDLVNQLQKSFAYHCVQIYLQDTKNETLTLQAMSGDNEGVIGTQIPIGQETIGLVAKNGEPSLSNNLSEDSRIATQLLLPKTESEIVVPLRKIGSKGQPNTILGVLTIQENQINLFSTKDVSMIQTIADQAAIAIDNARLLAERQKTIIELKKLDKAKSQFMAMISHELRTPLNAVLGFSELLLLGFSGKLSKKMRTDIELIKGGGEHLLKLVNNILDITKIESGLTQISPISVNLYGVIADVLVAASVSNREKSLAITSDIPNSLPNVFVDYARLHQIMLNLLDNAIKFTSEGTISVKARIFDDDTDFILISVADTGVGIKADKRQLIFQSFRQADMTDTRAFEGSGLGLSICKLLIELHGGRIWVESKEHVGSTFYFTLPISQE